jgi:hypothetical protein
MTSATIRQARVAARRDPARAARHEALLHRAWKSYFRLRDRMRAEQASGEEGAGERALVLKNRAFVHCWRAIRLFRSR